MNYWVPSKFYDVELLINNVYADWRKVRTFFIPLIEQKSKQDLKTTKEENHFYIWEIIVHFLHFHCQEMNEKYCSWNENFLLISRVCWKCKKIQFSSWTLKKYSKFLLTAENDFRQIKLKVK